MKKADVLALLKICEREAEYALSRTDLNLSDEIQQNLIKTLQAIKDHEAKLEMIPEENQKAIDSYYHVFSNLYTGLKNINQPNQTTAIQVKNDEPKDLVKLGSENAIVDNGHNTEIVKTDDNTDIVEVPGNIEDETEDEEEKKGNAKRVVRVIPEEEQQEETKTQRDNLTKHLKRIFYVLGSIAAVAIIVAAIKYYIDHPKDRQLDDTPRTTQSDLSPHGDRMEVFEDGTIDNTTDEEVQKIFNIANVDIENYDELLEYATEIRDELNGSGLTIDDIMYAIRMANWDKLQDKSWFEDRQGVCRSTYNAGLVTTALGSNAIVQKEQNSDIYITDQQMKDILMTVTDGKLSLDDFEDAKVENKGYDIYSVLDTCVAGLNAHKGSTNEEEILSDTDYVRVLNELTARLALDFSICNSDQALLSTVYTVLGTYTVNKNRILELTQQDGPIYGYGTRIDGNHGYICTLEEVTWAFIDPIDINGVKNFIGNEKNIFYSGMIDEVVLNPGMGLN